MAIFSSEQRDAIKTFLSDMLEEFGKNCTLIYQAKIVPCTDCPKPVNSNYYESVSQNGDYLPVHGMGCPTCNGTGVKQEEYTDSVKLVIQWDFVGGSPIANVQLPYGTIKTRGYIVDYTKVAKCIEMRVSMPDGGLIGRYRLTNEIRDTSSIVQNEFFEAVWSRVS